MENRQLHDLIKTTLNDLRPAFKEHPESFKINRNQQSGTGIRNSKPLPRPYSYYHAVFYYASNITSTLERLDETLFYIQKIPHQAAFIKKGITEDKWIEYHYCSHAITMTAIYDIALILTGTVFRLGLDPKHCNDNTIRDNAHIYHTPVRPAIKDLQKTIDPHRSTRNHYVHRGEIPFIEPIDHLKVFSIADRLGTPAIDKKTLRKYYIEAAGDIVKEIKDSNSKIQGATLKLLDTLLPFYRKNVEQLQASILSSFSKGHNHKR